MAMTFRTSDDLAAALRQRSVQEGRSQHDIVVAAVEEYLERHGKRDLIDRVLDDQLPRYAEAIVRLGE